MFMPGFLLIVELWVVVSACLVAGGWILSALGQLNGAGYVVLLALTAMLCWRLYAPPSQGHSPRKLVKRFRRPLPLLFLVLAGCALVGGVIYAPANYDGLAYRVPRALNWLAAERWHWIDTMDPRFNVRAAGFEWLMTPLMLLTKSDRFTFLINFISFVLLPGLVFSVFTRIGVRARVAWYWMWLLPGGYVFVLQAGSINNDAFATIYVLAAIDFALRGDRSKQFRHLLLSLLAIALATGAKATNLPLGLPWLAAAYPVLMYWIRRRPALFMATGLVAAFVSFVPVAILNQSHCGDWTGVSQEEKGGAPIAAQDPFFALTFNAGFLGLQSVLPPFFPAAGWLNARLPELQPDWLAQGFVRKLYYTDYKIAELPVEDSAGIGFGPTVLLFGAVFAGVVRRRRCPVTANSAGIDPRRQLIFALSSFVAVAAVLSKSAFPCGRIVAPYYPLLFCSALLVPGVGAVVRQKWWRLCAMAAMLLAVPVVVFTPPRPLFPVATVIRLLKDRWPASSAIARAERVYSVYALRSDALAPIRRQIATDVETIGFVSLGNDLETSLWRPYFKRRVVHLLPNDPARGKKTANIEVVVINGEALDYKYKMSISDWCAKHGAQVDREIAVPILASRPDTTWYIARFPGGQTASRHAAAME